MNKALLEQQLAQLPLVAYAFFPTDALEFSDRVRTICRTQCPRYGKSYACPPAVGTVAACRARCLAYPEGLLLATAAETDNPADAAQSLATRAAHEEATLAVVRYLQAQGCAVYALSAVSCALCDECAYPAAPCRKPEEMHPCVESHGILVTALAERCGVAYQAEGAVITWFSLLLYR